MDKAAIEMRATRGRTPQVRDVIFCMAHKALCLLDVCDLVLLSRERGRRTRPCRLHHAGLVVKGPIGDANSEGTS